MGLRAQEAFFSFGMGGAASGVKGQPGWLFDFCAGAWRESTHCAMRAISSAASGLPPIGMAGFFSPRRYWSSGLAALLPGITAGPWMLPPSSRSASVSRFKPLVCLAVLWQLKQRASSTGRTSLSNVDRSAAKRLAEAMDSTTTCHSIV